MEISLLKKIGKALADEDGRLVEISYICCIEYGTRSVQFVLSCLTSCALVSFL